MPVVVGLLILAAFVGVLVWLWTRPPTPWRNPRGPWK